LLRRTSTPTPHLISRGFVFRFREGRNFNANVENGRTPGLQDNLPLKKPLGTLPLALLLYVSYVGFSGFARMMRRVEHMGMGAVGVMGCRLVMA
jgi:hypothetical protein